MFTKQIIQVAEKNVYTAIGYTVSANSMIVGDDGVVIVDPGQLPTASALLRQEFEKITDKPVRAIIYTHGHNDHTNGAIAFYEEDKDIQIWARPNFKAETARQAEVGLAAGARPSNTQGFDLREEQKIGVGIAIPLSKTTARWCQCGRYSDCVKEKVGDSPPDAYVRRKSDFAGNCRNQPGAGSGAWGDRGSAVCLVARATGTFRRRQLLSVLAQYLSIAWHSPALGTRLDRQPGQYDGGRPFGSGWWSYNTNYRGYDDCPDQLPRRTEVGSR